jgi:Pyridoxal-dependent decarboxylase, pyridoxal binding domain
MAKTEFNMDMTILDIGGGFPGETHSMWNPAVELDEEEKTVKEGKVAPPKDVTGHEEEDDDRFMFFKEIAEQVSPVIDRLFPEDSGVRVIGEPGRYFVAACASLCCSVVSTRSNEVDNSFEPEPIDDKETANTLANMSREEEDQLVRKRGMSFGDQADGDNILNTIQEELQEYSKLFASQQLAQQEVDVYTDQLDLYREGYQSATEMLGPPDESQIQRAYHTAEGCSYPLVCDDDDDPSGLLTLAAAGEAVINGVVMQAVADSAPLQDDYAYYINDGVYGAFNVSTIWASGCL